MKDDSPILEENSSKLLIRKVLFWPIFIMRRMIRYEEMKQTLKFVEEKLDAYYNENEIK